ncbi:site-2 protease family protein [Candidatus Harpocratesius sp.]
MDLSGLVLSLIQSPLFIISLSFWLIAFILIKILGKKRDNVTLFFPFLILIRSKWLNKLFHRIAKKSPKFWKFFWNIGIVISFILMLYALYFFVSNFFQLIINPKPENAIMPLIPGVTIDLPMFTVMIIPLLITITVHEFSHAIAAETDGVQVKSSGILGAGIFFIVGYGAFVEVDDFQLNSRAFSSGTRLRVAAAGVWSNIILAGFIFLLLFLYPQTMQLSYETQGFQITEVVTNNEGGYNEFNLQAGDIVLKVNGTLIDNFEGPTLTQILLNQTADQTGIRCSAGDRLIFECYNSTSHAYYSRTVVLGARSYVGFSFEKYNTTAFKVTEIVPAIQGGNNYELDLSGKIFTHINGTLVNYDNNITLNTFLTQFTPDYKLVLTDDRGINITIDVNFAPQLPMAHVLRNVFVGINFTQIDADKIQISQILANNSEGGINEGRIPEGTIITKINGIFINLANQSFRDFIFENINPHPGDHLIFTDETGQNYTINTAAIPVIPVYIGISSRSYGIPKNWLGRITGPNFPIKYYQFLFYTWMISFSLALFNLLPAGIFDGGRMMKEVVAKIVGERYDTKAIKKLRYEFNPEDRKQHLFTHNIHKILSCRIAPEEQKSTNLIESQTQIQTKIQDQNQPQKEISELMTTESTQISTEIKDRDLKFKAIDTYGNGYIDTIEIVEIKVPSRKTIIEVEVEFEHDEKELVKKRIYRVISWLTGAIIAASLIISLVKFNDTFFWL